MATSEAIVFYSRVLKLVNEQRTVRVVPAGDGNFEAVKEDLGWFMLLEGSSERLHVGMEKPEFAVGDRVKVTIAKL
jgi:hypothetical protein